MLKEEGTQINIHLHCESSDLMGGEPKANLYKSELPKRFLSLYTSLHLTSPFIPSSQATDMWQQPVSHPSARPPVGLLRHTPSALPSERMNLGRRHPEHET